MPGQAQLLSSYQQNERVRALTEQKQRDQNLKFNAEQFDKDKLDNFETKNLEFDKALSKEANAVMEAHAAIKAKFDRSGDRIPSEVLNEFESARRRVKQHAVFAKDIVAQYENASKILEDDKFGKYNQEKIKGELYEVPKDENGEIDFTQLNPKHVEKVLSNPENFNKEGLYREMYDSFEENVATELSTEREAGQLFNTRNTITYKGSIVMDENGDPVRDKEGRLIPLVNSNTMALVKETQPTLYAKIKKESQETGESMQDIYLKDMQAVMGVNEKKSRSRVPESGGDGDGLTKTERAKQQFVSKRFEILQRMTGLDKQVDTAQAGALFEANGIKHQYRYNTSGMDLKTQVKGGKAKVGDVKALEIQLPPDKQVIAASLDPENVKGDKLVFDLSSREKKRKAVQIINRILNEINRSAGSEVLGEELLPHFDSLDDQQIANIGQKKDPRGGIY